ncbi:MAG: hypothetical protein A2Z34_03995 [Planctomycetes bacterium RBG_16_59_8]|nr:MAG: hypothetical protein A2Z34_03995 [Planctomycetes bacterium RBG_16_59_8]
MPTKRFLVAALSLVALALPGAAQEKKEEPKGKEPAKIVFKHPGIMVGDDDLKTIRNAIRRNIEPQASTFRELIKAADEHLSRAPDPLKEMSIPPYYNDKQKHVAARGSLDRDCDAVYTLALAAALTGEGKYADKALQFVNAWVKNCKIGKNDGDTPLIASRTLVLMVYAADLLWNNKKFTKSDKEEFLAWAKGTVYDSGVAIRRAVNNWGAWGVQASMAWTILAEDETLFRETVEVWKRQVEANLNADGAFQHELKRHDGDKGQGISYSQFALQACTLSAEMASRYDVDLFAWKTSGGKGLKEAAEKIYAWEKAPETFPFSNDYKQTTGAFYACWEILYRRYKAREWRQVLNERRKHPWQYPFAHRSEAGAWLPLTHGAP